VTIILLPSMSTVLPFSLELLCRDRVRCTRTTLQYNPGEPEPLTRGSTPQCFTRSTVCSTVLTQDKKASHLQTQMSPKGLQPQSHRFKLLLGFAAGAILGAFMQRLLSSINASSSKSSSSVKATKNYASKGMVASLKDIPHRPTSHIDTGNYKGILNEKSP
jgi:hypothetical protein